MRKIIGVMPLYDDEKESYWMLPGYMNMLEEQGAIPLMLPLTANPEALDYFLEICGGFLLTGGHDVSPEVYGAERSALCGPCCALRDRMEIYILHKAVEQDKSVLGICRGIQLMNAVFGGTLYQDLPAEYGSSVEHHMELPYDRAVHRVSLMPGGPLFAMLGKEEIGVNSYHHQAIRTLSPHFHEMARSEDGLVEGIYMPDRTFLMGVQWHPEFSYRSDENSRKLIGAFVASVR